MHRIGSQVLPAGRVRAVHFPDPRPHVGLASGGVAEDRGGDERPAVGRVRRGDLGEHDRVEDLALSVNEQGRLGQRGRRCRVVEGRDGARRHDAQAREQGGGLGGAGRHDHRPRRDPGSVFQFGTVVGERADGHFQPNGPRRESSRELLRDRLDAAPRQAQRAAQHAPPDQVEETAGRLQLVLEEDPGQERAEEQLTQRG